MHRQESRALQWIQALNFPTTRASILASMIGVFASTVSHLGMAYVAHDFATGMIFRAIAGFGWAGTYMVGLRVLSDELEGRIRSRGVAFHAGAMGAGGSLSFFLAGEIDRWLGWEAAFLVSAAGTAGAFLVLSRRTSVSVNVLL